MTIHADLVSRLRNFAGLVQVITCPRPQLRSNRAPYISRGEPLCRWHRIETFLNYSKSSSLDALLSRICNQGNEDLLSVQPF
jgi:hypothetical protein